jgi:hypothetical protein
MALSPTTPAINDSGSVDLPKVAKPQNGRSSLEALIGAIAGTAIFLGFAWGSVYLICSATN